MCVKLGLGDQIYLVLVVDIHEDLLSDHKIFGIGIDLFQYLPFVSYSVSTEHTAKCTIVSFPPNTSVERCNVAYIVTSCELKATDDKIQVTKDRGIYDRFSIC
jgi:hypothetical protein